MGIFSVNLLFSDLQYIQKLLACTGGGVDEKVFGTSVCVTTNKEIRNIYIRGGDFSYTILLII